jgi:hypothetical protein
MERVLLSAKSSTRENQKHVRNNSRTSRELSACIPLPFKSYATFPIPTG